MRHVERRCNSVANLTRWHGIRGFSLLQKSRGRTGSPAAVAMASTGRNSTRTSRPKVSYWESRPLARNSARSDKALPPFAPRNFTATGCCPSGNTSSHARRSKSTSTIYLKIEKFGKKVPCWAYTYIRISCIHIVGVSDLRKTAVSVFHSLQNMRLNVIRDFVSGVAII